MRVRFGVMGWVGAAAMVLVAAAVTPSLRWFRQVRCDRAIEERRFSEAIVACAGAFEAERQGRFAGSVAMAHVALGQMDEAWRWANAPEASDQVRAMRVRGVVLKVRGETEEARATLQAAMELALERGAPGEAARAAHTLAGIHWEQGRYSAAYDAIEVSEREAARAGDGPALALAEVARGDIFRKLGDAQRAEVSYRRAIEAATPWPADHAFARLKMGIALMERGLWGLAQENLQHALVLAESTDNRALARSIRMNLVESMVRASRFDEAERHFSRLGEEDPRRLTKSQRFSIQVLKARLAVARGDAAAALGALDEIEPTEVARDSRWELETTRGHALLAAGRPEEASNAWLAAVEEVEALSASEPEHQGWVAARRREPFDALFSLWARRSEHARAWDIVARYSLSESLSITVHEVEDPRGMVEAAEKLKVEWSSRGNGQGVRTPSALPDAVEVLALHEAQGRLWVGTRRSGKVRFVDVGSSPEFEPLLLRFMGDAGDSEAAETLGTALWKAAGLAPSGRPLYVGATGRLRRLAFSALRHDGRFWVELRPMARLPSLTGRDGPPPRFEGPPVVAGDPTGDLAAAREEVSWVASRLNVTGLVGAAATREAILSARGRSVLHVATHAAIGLEGTRLMLADGVLTAHEILREHPHARLVVLASCASGMGRDAAGSDSLSTAFLRAGSGAVLSTLRTVPDAAAQRMVRAFYEQGGLRDPVAALSRAQVSLASEQPVSVWSAFNISVGWSLTALEGRKAANDVE